VITVHGRFQPPLHVNHWMYVAKGFEQAEHVSVLITNPFHDEGYEETASWRNKAENNPFTYAERIQMFAQFFTRMGIEPRAFDFRPFNIKDDLAFDKLDPEVPNLVNVYSEWSAKKVELFEDHGLRVIRLENPETSPVSGTAIRDIITATENIEQLPPLLADAGFMPQAIPGLLEVLASRNG